MIRSWKVCSKLKKESELVRGKHGSIKLTLMDCHLPYTPSFLFPQLEIRPGVSLSGDLAV